MCVLLSSVALLLCLSVNVHAQAPAPALLAGSVLTDSTERPIANAEIVIAALKLSVRSDSAGAFTLGGIPAGRYSVVVRAPGYAEFSALMTFDAGKRTEADLLLRPNTQQLSRVDVTATKRSSGNNPRIAEFDERRAVGLGQFLTQEVFEKADGRKLADVLVERIPGLRAQMYGGHRALISSRGVSSMNMIPSGDTFDKQQQAPPRCYVAVIVDDIVRYGSKVGETLLDIDSIDPKSIAAIEYYTVSNRPTQFNRGGNAPCGTLVIWSRY
jgi:hypothetical protein